MSLPGSKQPASFLTDNQSKRHIHRLATGVELICQSGSLIRHSKRRTDPVPSILVGEHVFDRSGQTFNNQNIARACLQDEISSELVPTTLLLRDKTSLSAIKKDHSLERLTLFVLRPSIAARSIQIDRKPPSILEIHPSLILLPQWLPSNLYSIPWRTRTMAIPCRSHRDLVPP